MGKGAGGTSFGEISFMNLLFVNLKMPIALGGWLSWLEHHLLRKKSWGFNSPSGHIPRTHKGSNLSVSLNIFSGEDLKRKEKN